MKQSDIISIVLVASVGALMAFFGARALLEEQEPTTTTFNRVVSIETTLTEPDSELFNEDAINPTVEAKIDSCEDTNGNGILDPDEQRRCLGQEEESEEGEGETSNGATN